MKILLIVSVVVIVVLVALVMFLGRELLKHFERAKRTEDRREGYYSFCYRYKGSSKPRMRKIMISSEDRKPFYCQVGMRFQLFGYDGIDYFGSVDSDDEGVAVIETYLGRGSCEFYFLENRQTILSINTLKDDSSYIPCAVFPPHWWQRLGFWG